MPHLEFLQGERRLFFHRLPAGRTVIGRADLCDVALPSDDVSRIHCMVEQRSEGWWLIDRSRHGTRINGQIIHCEPMAHGDCVGIGPYTARFMVSPTEATPTASPYMPAVHEELVEISEDQVASTIAELHFTQGSWTGRSLILDRPRTRIGGAGAEIVIDEEWPDDAVILRVIRGRVLVEPGRIPISLAGARVRQTTPAWIGEELLFGSHGCTVNVHTGTKSQEDIYEFGELVGSSSAMRRVFGILTRVAAHDHPVLLTGESGCGKDLAARALHDSSIRASGAFIAMNCAAITDSLFESELFGHEKGAFTGATCRQDGAFQRADQGTLFLDEIGELGLEGQAKLLRALNSGEVRRVGGSKPEFPDVRIIAATNRDLYQMVRAGTFRSDLLFRLAVLTVHLPPLRERKADIPVLARALLQRFHPGSTLSEDAVAALEAHVWPGNVRELRNVLTRAIVMTGTHIQAPDLEFHTWAFERTDAHPRSMDSDTERATLQAALERHDGNRTRAARELGMPRSSLLYKLQRLGIS